MFSKAYMTLPHIESTSFFIFLRFTSFYRSNSKTIDLNSVMVYQQAAFIANCQQFGLWDSWKIRDSVAFQKLLVFDFVAAYYLMLLRL